MSFWVVGGADEEMVRDGRTGERTKGGVTEGERE